MNIYTIRKEKDNEEFNVDIADQLIRDNGSIMDFPELDIFEQAA